MYFCFSVINWNFSFSRSNKILNFHFCISLIVNFLLVGVPNGQYIMIFNKRQGAEFDKVCATKVIWSQSHWIDLDSTHSVPWPLSLSLSLSLYTWHLDVSHFDVIYNVWFPLEESLWITRFRFIDLICICHAYACAF